MNILCPICQDILEPSNDMFITPCGHVFHFPCLNQWLENAQSCPQCRQKVKRDRITRIYFTFTNTEAVKEDSFTLQQKVDSLSFQNKLREAEMKNCREEIATLKRQNVGLREEVKKTESEISRKNSAIHALQQQTIHFKEQCHDYDKLQKEIKTLQTKIETYESIKLLVNSTSEAVDEVLSRTKDVNTLSTYVAIMKRELSSCLSKRKELRETIKRLRHDLQTTKMERNSVLDDYVKKNDQLELELAIYRREKDNLLMQIMELKRTDCPIENCSEAASNLSLDPIPSRKRETDFVQDIDSVLPKKMKQEPERFSFEGKDLNNSDLILVTPTVKKSKENEENSPYLPTKSKSVLTLKEGSSVRTGFSVGTKRNLLSLKKSNIAVKSSREKDLSLNFDGFGGHSRIETFPLPKSSPIKNKRPVSEISKNKKMKLETANKNLDDFIINLT